MGMLINGKWENTPLFNSDDKGSFVRPASPFRHWIKADGSSDYPAESHRYHLYLSYACPWACRALIMRALKNNVIKEESQTIQTYLIIYGNCTKCLRSVRRLISSTLKNIIMAVTCQLTLQASYLRDLLLISMSRTIEIKKRICK